MTLFQPTTIERRVSALEARVADIENSYGETLYELRRHSVKTDLRLAKLLAHFDVSDVGENEVDAELDQQ